MIEQVRLGASGLHVSRLALGMMSFGDTSRRAWVLDEQAAEPIVRHALDRGITFFDTADMYAGGASEIVTGRLLRKLISRDEVVVATKVFYPTTPGPNGGGLSRKHILAAIDASLQRLQLDHVDLYQIHRWDGQTPIEETMEALHDVVRAGKARYLGASTMAAWQFGKAQSVAERNGWTRFISMQNHYNLLYREEEREMIPLCLDQGVGVIPYSPLARGLLARAADGNHPTARAQSDPIPDRLYTNRGTPTSSRRQSSSRGNATSPPPRSHSPGSCTTPPSPRRSSAPPARPISTTPPPQPASYSPPTNARGSSDPTDYTPPTTTHSPQRPAPPAMLSNKSGRM
jgi:1-deoxyxylulose-5-phosphate synthase